MIRRTGWYVLFIRQWVLQTVLYALDFIAMCFYTSTIANLIVFPRTNELLCLVATNQYIYHTFVL